jgi:predicted aspartyl protease
MLKGVVPFRALIDTGATRTMIATRVVERLGLQQVNKIEVSGLGGSSWRRAYLFHVAFYATPPVDANDISTIHICPKEINGGELSDEHTFDVLLGMDVLTTGNLRVDKDGTFIFSF